MISTHILDTTQGVPATGVKVCLQKQNGSEWVLLEEGATNSDGRIVFGSAVQAGTYQLVFEVEEYLQKNAKESFFSHVPVIFKIHSLDRNYHVPLLLNPFGYSTYRGS